jgi:hypothetical protein
VLTGHGGAQSLSAVARAVQADWRVANLAFVVRRGSAPALFVFGDVDEPGRVRMDHLARQITRADHRAVYVGYAEARDLCAALAERLVDAYGARTVREFVYQPVPRGGLIVLGMLSYALNLTPDRLEISDDPGRPVVLVDDCVISGVRFTEHLSRVGDRRVICATLFAPADLLGASRDNNGVEFVAAQELSDRAPDLYGAACDSWRRRWTERLGDRALWIGQPEYLCFAWNEPQSSFMNAATGELESGFRLVPPERCPGPALNTGTEPADVQFFHPGQGDLRAASGVVSLQLQDGRVAVAKFSAGAADRESACFQLDETAGRMWALLRELPSVPEAAAQFCAEYDAPAGRMTEDMRRFADSLVSEGLLVRA